MILKNFQTKALDALECWIERLEYYQNKGYEWDHVIAASWNAFRKKYPDVKKDYRHRAQLDGKAIPHACIKIPTGGGKTFTAANALMLIMRKWVKRQTGLVIWVVPSNAIYEQTLNALRKKQQWIHQHLKQSSGGRLKVFTRGDNFTKDDIDQFLCVMVLIGQSFIEKKNDSAKVKRLKVNRTGNYGDFFPDTGNLLANEKFLEEHTGLDTLDRIGIPIQSLKNVIRVSKPVVIVDEAHRFTNKLNIAFEEINKLNPSIILEISATPLDGSNIVYAASGQEVWEEEMIKLPIAIHESFIDINETLRSAVTKRKELERIAAKELANGGNYVRPIMVIRVDFTGKKQVARPIHAYEVRDILISISGIKANEVAIHSSEQKDLAGVDLLSDECPIRYIITKDALKEGWDCPFASVLTILNENLKSPTAMTQLLGRVMRQPYAKRTKDPRLNTPYVFCYTDDVNKAIALAQKGLESEGYADVKDLVTQAGDGYSAPRKKSKRKEDFRDWKIYFPKVKFFNGSDVRDFNYDTDLLPRINWDSLKHRNDFSMQSIEAKEKVSWVGLSGKEGETKVSDKIDLGNEFDIVYLSERLLSVIPNIFVAAKIVNNALAYYCETNDFNKVFAQRIAIVEHIKEEISKDIVRLSRDVFDNLLGTGKIDVKFIKGLESKSDWEMPQFDFYRPDNADIYNQNKYVFEKVNSSTMNGEELGAANLFENNKMIQWWFRTTAKSVNSGYYLQGWKRKKMYPDFLLATAKNNDGFRKYLIIETKGAQFEDTPDTLYKAELSNLIERKMKEQGTDTYHFRVVQMGRLPNELGKLLEGQDSI